MTELVLWKPPPPVAIEIPHSLCEVPKCEGVRQYDMLAFFITEGRLEIYQVCGVHRFLWQHVTPSNFFMLNGTPNLQWVAEQVEAEYRRRNPPRPVYQNMSQNYFNNSTTTSTGGFYYRFG